MAAGQCGGAATRGAGLVSGQPARQKGRTFKREAAGPPFPSENDAFFFCVRRTSLLSGSKGTPLLAKAEDHFSGMRDFVFSKPAGTSLGPSRTPVRSLLRIPYQDCHML